MQMILQEMLDQRCSVSIRSVIVPYATTVDWQMLLLLLMMCLRRCIGGVMLDLRRCLCSGASSAKRSQVYSIACSGGGRNWRKRDIAAIPEAAHRMLK